VDLTLHGHSIGQREGDVLVVDTTAIAPQAYIAPSEAVRHSKRWRHSHRRAALFGQAE
jgi:hypothetical protein